MRSAISSACRKSLDDTATPHAHYVAPQSLLVFDHLTAPWRCCMRAARPSARACRREIVQALRGAAPAALAAGSSRPPPLRCRWSRTPARAARARIHRLRRRLSAGAASGSKGITRSRRSRSTRAAAPQSSRICFSASWANHRGRLFAGSPGQMHDGHAQLRPIAGSRPARRRCGRRRPAAGGAQGGSEGKCRARDAGRLARNDLGRVAIPGSVVVDPYRVIERYSHIMHIVSGVSGRLRRGRMPSTCSPRPFPPARWWARRRCAPWKSSMSSNRWTAIVWRDGGLFRTARRHGSGDHHPHLGFPGDSYSYQAGGGIVADSSLPPNTTS